MVQSVQRSETTELSNGTLTGDLGFHKRERLMYFTFPRRVGSGTVGFSRAVPDNFSPASHQMRNQPHLLFGP